MKLKRCVSFMLSAAMVMTAMPSSVVWAEEVPDTVLENEGSQAAQGENAGDSLTYFEHVEDVSGDLESLPENGDLFAAYVDSLFLGEPSVSTYGEYGKDQLEGVNAKAYEVLKAEIGKIASGERESTKIALTLENLGIAQIDWTAAELGLSELTVENGEFSQQVTDALVAKLSPDVRQVLDYLLVDCPWDLYWYDKTVVAKGTIGISYEGVRTGTPEDGSDTEEPKPEGGGENLGTEETEAVTTESGSGYAAVRVKAFEMTYSFAVAREYQGSSEYTVNTELAQSAVKAADNAKAIVSENVASDDYSKLSAYKDKICELTSYNHDAVTNHAAYGNPWQLIWVFDDDPNTEVVCEGYSKAFQYLCDMSEFQSADVKCYTVTGTMDGGTGAGGHMWNIASMEDQKNYIVDVTNCDEGSVGAPDQLFLAGASGTAAGGYAVEIGSQTIHYTYDSDMSGMYGELLQISDSDYTYETDLASGKYGDAINWTLDRDGRLNLTGTGAMTDAETVSPIPWEVHKQDIKSVAIGEGITDISPSAFADCTALTAISLPESLTGIGDNAFSGCTAMEEVEIPASVTEIGSNVFAGCSALKTVKFTGVCPANMQAAVFGDLELKVFYPEEHKESWQTFLASIDSEKGKITAEAYCEHNMIPTEAKPATCTEPGNIAYYTCGKCKKTFKDEAGTEELQPEDLVEGATGHRTIKPVEAKLATCVEDGVLAHYICEDCQTCFKDESGQEEIEEDETIVKALGHEMKKTNRTEPTCTIDGNIEYYTCSRCNKNFEDESGEHEIEEEGIKLKAGHSFGGWEDMVPAGTCTGEGEKRVCSKCGFTETQKVEDGGHAWELAFREDRAATCEQEGSESIHCSAAGCEAVKESRVVPVADHKLTLTEAVPAECTGGNIAYYTCSVCEKIFKDEAGNEEISIEDTVLPAVHSFDEEAEINTGTGCPSGGKKKVCSVCGFIETQDIADGHQWEDAPEVDQAATCTKAGSQSIHCSAEGCEAVKESRIIPAKGHSYGEWQTVEEASCTEEGSRTKECADCNDVQTEAIEALGHRLTEMAEVNATCTQEGCKAHWKCSVCDALFLDKEGEQTITQEQLEIPAAGHKFEWIIEKKPTVDEAGQRYQKCAVCQERGTEETIPKVEADHTHGGYTYQSDETGHKRICGTCYEEEEKEAHSYDTWKIKVQGTCTEPGTEYRACEVCGFEETREAKVSHTLTKTEKKAPSCTADGNEEYWTCGSCQQIFSDEKGTNATSAEERKIEATGHNFSSLWYRSEQRHFHQCSWCGRKKDGAEHEFKWKVDELPTADATGKRHEECSACGYQGREEEIEAVPEHNHAYGTAYESDENGHWKECSICYEKTENGAHTYGDWKPETESSCIESRECTVCGYKEVRGAESAVHSLIKTERTEPTCTEEGRKEYWTCQNCHLAFLDEAGRTIVDDVNDLTVAALGHAFSVLWEQDETNHYHTCSRCDAKIGEAGHDYIWKVDQKPTEGAEGLKHQECKVCGYVGQEESIDQVTEHNHVYEDNAYESDGTGHWQVCRICYEEAAKEAHTFGEWETKPESSCMKARTCTVCGYEEIEGTDTAHRLVKTEGADPTCTAAGHKAYWTCESCGQIFLGETEDAAIDDVRELVVPALGHSFGEEWESDADGHYHACSRCDEKKDKAEHTFEWIIDKKPTGEAEGLKHEECKVCGFRGKEETIGKVEAHEHAYGTSYESDATDHWQICSICYGESDKTPHVFGDWEPKEPGTCTEPGIEAQKCGICGYEATRESGVSHHLISVPESEATCTEDGYAAHWKCNDCGQLFSDADGKTPVNLGDLKTEDATGHTLNGTNEVPATCLQPGKHAYWTCENCSQIFSDADGKNAVEDETELEIPALGHAFSVLWEQDETNHYHTCSRCDAKTGEAGHDYIWKVDQKPTEEAEGLKHEECKVCGYKGQEASIDKVTEHNHVYEDNAYESDGTGHWKVCSTCYEETAKEAHTFSEWETEPESGCMKTRACTVCGYEEIEGTDTVHRLIKTEGADPTCMAAGHKAYWICESCGQIFLGEDEDTAIGDVRELVIPALGHSFGEEWESDADGHYHACSRCGEKKDAAEHTFEWKIDQRPTEEMEGHKHEECKVCGFRGNEETIDKVEAHDHAYGDSYESDATDHWQICSICYGESDKTPHNFSEWETKVPGTCTEPGVESRKCGICEYEDTRELGVSHNLISVPESEATCTRDGYAAHWKCSDCGQLFSDAEGKITTDLEELKTDSATGHDMTATEALAPTCTEAGHEAYWTCGNCGLLFEDENGEHETTLSELAISALGHDFGEAWETNADKHYHTCSRCDEKQDEADHSFEWVIDQEATGTADGIKHEECTVCHYKRNEGTIIPGHTHSYGEEYKSDETGHWHECACGSKSEIQPHTYGDWIETQPATCTAPGSRKQTCSVCQYEHTEEIPAAGHELARIPQEDATCTSPGNIEYYLCSKCHKTFRDEAGTTEIDQDDTVIAPHHTMQKTEAKASTCTEAGNIEYYTCTACHKLFREEAGTNEITQADTVLPLLSHNIQKVEAKAATCTEDGNREYYTCTLCHTAFSDSQGTTVISLASVTIPAEHILEHVEAKPATCDAPGNTEYFRCSRCEKLFTDSRGTIETTLAAVTTTASHNMTRVAAKAATCTEAGNIEHYFCSLCQKRYRDEAGRTELQESDAIPPLGHNMTKTDRKEATCTEAGNIEYYTCSRCSKRYTDEAGTTETTAEATVIPAKNHTLVQTPAKAATCTEAGNIEYYTCSECGRLYRDAQGTDEISEEDTVIAAGHSYGEWTVTKEPTCTEAGERGRTCSVCNQTETEAIEATGHTMERTEKIDPTCTEAGSIEYYTCSVCSKTFADAEGTEEVSAEEIVQEALGHDLTRTEAVPATCTEAGNRAYYTCGRCGKVYADEGGTEETTLEAVAIPALGHTLAKTEAKAATCTEAGNIEYYTCSECGRLYRDAAGTEEISIEDTVTAPGHHYGEWTDVKEPTCTEAGQRERVCSECGDTQTEEIEMLAHTTEKTEPVPATCTKAGSIEYYTCTVCHKMFADEDASEELAAEDTVIEALGHTMSKTEAKDATCMEEGNIEYYTCGRCGKLYRDEEGTEEISIEDTRTAVTGHTFGEWILLQAPTATETGLRKRVCSVCGFEETEVIDALGHDWEEEYTIDIEPTCTTEGQRSIHCRDCDEVKDVQIIPALGHSYGEWITETEPTCTLPGERSRICGVCGYEETEGMAALGHDWGDGYTTDRRPTCTEEGSQSMHCGRCGEIRRETIPALGHSLVKTEAVAATCTANGHMEYYTCFVCRRMFSDEAAEHEVSEAEIMETERASHLFETVVVPATAEKNGSVYDKCSVCGSIANTRTINRPGAVALSKTSYVYDGSAKKPSVTVYDNKGNIISANAYTVSYSKNKKVGKAEVQITFRGDYSGTVTRTFEIRPKGTSVVKLTALTKGFTVKWKKGKKQTTGYQIQFATNKNFKNAKNRSYEGATKAVILKLSAKKKYFVRIRTYKTVDGVRVYSGWSKVKSVKTKK